ncbi:pyridoxal 5'-phosphate synthase glutaminase subunit PdxT [Cetobacterium sp. SF1]|uniref:pyridoxal 5'-phosphate synthase glutaminase subunit PdxT n=1 Tax=unclassified Cetobacterium TaxID=2630983 RepID=UPI003CF40F62
MIIGVLALQGAFREHIEILKKLSIEAKEIRCIHDLDNIDGLIIPGGESTAIGKLLVELNIKNKLKDMIKNGFPVFGTCAGMIILAKKLTNDNLQHLGVLDIEVKRNAYGRQLGSFITMGHFDGIDGEVQMVFIRAPYIEKVGKDIKILSIVDNNIVAARSKNILVTSFHPELTKDTRVHQYFLNMCKKESSTN